MNVANTNIDGNWFLVLVNEAGNWIGQIFGGEEGSNIAGNAATDFTVDANGNVTVGNTGNGSGSTNTATADVTNNSTVEQTNTAEIVNNISLGANTGKNSASKNTGGSNMIETGDANIVANIVNFVNTNITGGGNLFVTVVNVFGSWTGDFVTPWSKKPEVASAPEQTPNNGSSENAEESNGNGGNEQNNTLAIGGTGESTDNTSSPTTQTSLNTPTPTTTSQSLVAAAIATLVPSSGKTANEEDPQPTDTNEAIAYVPEVNAAQSPPRKTVDINLAWTLLLIPIGGIAFGIRKLLIKRALEIRN
ncbi:MAG TPA: hypothetical protein VJL83_01650 [Patescibacteria group bacterium]|nr:hypothetical protein [Patescibacteria group bacterium]